MIAYVRLFTKSGREVIFFSNGQFTNREKTSGRPSLYSGASVFNCRLGVSMTALNEKEMLT